MPFSVSGQKQKINAEQLSAGIGTLCAISKSSKSARPFNAKRSVFTWGGARNRAERVSSCVTLEQASGLIIATRRAYSIGLPLNRHVTIHWARAGIEDSEAAAATGAFLTLVRDWLRKCSHQFAYVWVRENDDGDGSKGSHVHILMHIPAAAAWTFWRSRRWLERVTGLPYRRGVIHTSRVAGAVRAHAIAPERYLANLSAVVAYIAKGVSARTAAGLGLEQSEAGGRVVGKRVGWSQNIGEGSNA